MRTDPTEIYLDFEYQSDPTLRPILGCFAIYPPDGDHREVEIDLRQGRSARSEFAALYHRYKANGIWLSYSALAEAQCVETLGFDARALNWVCLMAEAKQVVGSHPRFLVGVNAASLLICLQKFDIPSEFTKQQKDLMRDLILHQSDWSPEQWAEIARYCWHDVHVLRPLWQRIQAVHANANTPWTVNSAMFHGEYLAATAHLDHHSPGFPIDIDLLDQFYSNLPHIKEVLVSECNERYGNQLWLRDKQGDWHFKPGGLRRHLDDLRTRGLDINWPTTDKTTLPKTDEDTLDTMARKYPHFKPLSTTRRLLQQLKRTDLRRLLHDGYIKGTSLPYHTVTGRNQPLPASGFILNLPSWMRSLMRPPPGKVIVAADWSQQEVVLAAALSGDHELAQAINSGDVYLHMAKRAGFVPAFGTKEAYKAERDTFKTLQLGIQYSMGRDSLARNLYLAMLDQQGMTYAAAYDLAGTLLDWHRRTHSQFWHWKSRIEAAAKQVGYIAGKDLWTMFVGPRTKPTTIGNFPCQAGGAAMMRQAVKRLAKEPDLTFICSHHDALYLLADECDVGPQRGEVDFNKPIGPTEAKLVRCMNAAATDILDVTENPNLKIRIDLAIYTHEQGYFDERGRETYDRVMQIIAEDSVAPDLRIAV